MFPARSAPNADLRCASLINSQVTLDGVSAPLLQRLAFDSRGPLRISSFLSNSITTSFGHVDLLEAQGLIYLKAASIVE